MRVPHEEKQDSMTIFKVFKSVLWRPNNYRRKVHFRGFINSGLGGTIFKGYKGVNVSKSRKSVVYIRGLADQVIVQIGRKTITAIWGQKKIGGSKQTFAIHANSEGELDRRVDEKKQEIKQLLDGVLSKVCRELNVSVKGSPEWDRHEDWIKGEEYIDSLPINAVIHDTVGKKVYGKGFEFTGGELEEPLVKMKNYIKNRAVEDKLPRFEARLEALAGGVDDLGEGVRKLSEEALLPLTAQIKLHLEVQKETLLALKDMRDLMKKERVKRLKEEWGW